MNKEEVIEDIKENLEKERVEDIYTFSLIDYLEETIEIVKKDCNIHDWEFCDEARVEGFEQYGFLTYHYYIHILLDEKGEKLFHVHYLTVKEEKNEEGVWKVKEIILKDKEDLIKEIKSEIKVPGKRVMKNSRMKTLIKNLKKKEKNKKRRVNLLLC